MSDFVLGIYPPNECPADKNMHLGRVGDDVAVTCVEAWDFEGADRIGFRGAVIPTINVDQAKMLRDQLVNLQVNRDEPVIPIRWGLDPTIDGFYTIENIDVPMLGPSLIHGIWPFRGIARRIRDYRFPKVTSSKVGAFRSNAHGQVTGSTAVWRHVLPLAAEGLAPIVAGTYATRYADVYPYLALVGPGAVAMRVVPAQTQATINPGIRDFSYYLKPEDWYDGGCVIRAGQNFDDSTPFTALPGLSESFVAVGQNWPLGPREWFLCNGICAFWPTSDADFAFGVHHPADGWEGQSAVSAKLFRIADFSGGSQRNLGDDAQLKPVAASIVRNGPEEVIVRVLYADPSPVQTTDEHVQADFTLRRGARHVDITLQRSRVGSGNSLIFEIQPQNAEAGTFTASFYWRASANDAVGNRYVVTAAKGTLSTPTTTRFRATGTGVTVQDFAYGIELDGSGAVAPDDALSIARDHYDGWPEKTTFGRR